MVKSSSPVYAAEDKVAILTGPPFSRSNSAAARKVFHAAERSPEFFDHLRAHYREARRTSVEINADIKLKLLTGDIFDSGTATILNVSPSGALLGNMKLSKKAFPAEPFNIEIILKGDEYEGIGVEAKPVRFDLENRGIGVKFQEIFVAV